MYATEFVKLLEQEYDKNISINGEIVEMRYVNGDWCIEVGGLLVEFNSARIVEDKLLDLVLDDTVVASFDVKNVFLA